MATTYDEYKKKADQNIAEEEKRLTAQGDTLYETQAAAIDKQTAAGQQTFDKQKATADTQYRGLYDANAVQELIDRNTISERMANLGLSKSGLNATQQTAVALSRGNRDADITRQKQEYMDTIDQAIADMYTKAEADKTAARLAIDQDKANRLDTYRTAQYGAIGDWAKADYDREVALEKEKNARELELTRLEQERQIQQAQLEQERLIKQAQLEQERLIKQAQSEEEARKRETEMLWEAFLSDREYGDTTGSGYSYMQSLLGGGAQQSLESIASQMKSGAITNDEAVQAVIYDLYPNDTAAQTKALQQLGFDAPAISVVIDYYGKRPKTTEPQVERTAENTPLEQRNWTRTKMTRNSGINTFLNLIDDNDEVTDEFGNTKTMRELYNELISGGRMDSKSAKEYILSLQKQAMGVYKGGETYTAKTPHADELAANTWLGTGYVSDVLKNHVDSGRMTSEDAAADVVNYLYPYDTEKQKIVLGKLGFSDNQIDLILEMSVG